MCGVFAYYTYNVPRNVKAILDTLFNGLKRLEYRGYDSSGLAVDLVDSLQAVKEGCLPEENGTHDTALPLIVKEVHCL
jgi:glucosamine--fructose-6-phosphate aminotransferase (isomerizing)